MPENTAPIRAAGSPAACLRAAGLGVLALATLSAGDAWSHAIQSNLEKVTPLSEQVRREFLLQSAFSTGEPAEDATVRLWRPDGSSIDLGRTDGEGSLRFSVPADAASDWELQVDAGPGHRDYLELAEGADAQAAAAGPSLPSWRRPGVSRLLAQRPAGALQPLVGGLTVGLVGAAGMLLVARRRR